MKLDAWLLRQPVVRQSGLAVGMIVDDQVQIEVFCARLYARFAVDLACPKLLLRGFPGFAGPFLNAGGRQAFGTRRVFTGWGHPPVAPLDDGSRYCRLASLDQSVDGGGAAASGDGAGEHPVLSSGSDKAVIMHLIFKPLKTLKVDFRFSCDTGGLFARERRRRFGHANRRCVFAKAHRSRPAQRGGFYL